MKYRVVCEIRSPYGNRTMTARSGLTWEEAQQVAGVLNEGALSNPRSTAAYHVEEEHP